jgi:uncharacterized transporter YbjL
VVKYVFFDLFLFTTGYKVGPQFFRALKKGRVAADCIAECWVFISKADVVRTIAVFKFRRAATMSENGTVSVAKTY